MPSSLARNLALTPSNTKNPAWMARQARAVARRSGLDVTVWDDAGPAPGRLRRDPRRGAGVGHPTAGWCGSTTSRPGATAATPRVVLVGKGITFDTGGLQVKPVDGMLGMKTDMSGSAIVLAVLAACRELEVPVRVTGLLALAENAVGGASYRPGDVVTQYGGRTVEIGNTDAEGRIVLADALAYADAAPRPATSLVDVATLTGAARIALGRVAAPVFATDAVPRRRARRAPARRLVRRCGRCPLADDLPSRPGLRRRRPQPHRRRRRRGAVTAALFLREFVGERRWAHLDIAGTGRSDVDAGIPAKGATGFGTRLLLRWLEEMA